MRWRIGLTQRRARSPSVSGLPVSARAFIDRLARGAALGGLDDVLAMLACARFFRDGHPELEAMRASAREAGLPFATAILEPANDHRALSRRGQPRDIGGPSRIVRHGFLVESPTDGEERRTRAGYGALESFVRESYGPLPPSVLEATIESLFGVEKDLMSQEEEEARAARLEAVGPVRIRAFTPTAIALMLTPR